MKMGKSSGSAPAAPDPYAVAGAQQGLNTSTARLNAQLNRPNVVTPFGTQTWTQGTPSYDQNAYQAALSRYNNPASGGIKGILASAQNRGAAPNLEDFRVPGSDQWTSTMTLGPEGQNLLDQYRESSAAPFSLSGAMDTLSSVMEPRYQRDQDALDTRLVNSGFRRGSQGFDQAQQDFQINKDVSRAATAQQALQLASGLRTQPLTELNMLRNPQQMQPGGQVGVNPADIGGPFSQQYQGQLARYNAGVGSDNAKLGAGTTLAAAYMLSDRRLKSNIKRIGTHKLGIGIYEYDIGREHQIGVMADEVEKVMPSAVKTINGFKAVDYAQLA